MTTPPRPSRPPRQPGPGSSNGTANAAKVNSKKFGASFSPGLTLNINAANRTNTVNGGGGGGRAAGGGVGADLSLPEPDFGSPAQIRNYCNSLRSLATGFAFEVAMAAEILQSTLAQVPDPDGRPFGSRMRARRVARKLSKSADAMKASAVNAAATYAAFIQEFQGEVNAVRHRARRPQGRPFDFSQQ